MVLVGLAVIGTLETPVDLAIEVNQAVLEEPVNALGELPLELLLFHSPVAV